jgi:hypothetical protein
VLPAGVIEALDVIKGHELSGAFGWREAASEAFGLESGYEALREGIVIGITRAAHAWGDVVESLLEAEGRGGVLAAAVAVMDEAWRDGVALQSSSEGGCNQSRGEVIAAMMREAALGGLRPEAALLLWAKALLAHQSSDPVLAAANATLAQIVAQPRTAIAAATLLEALAEDGAPLGVLLAARPGSFAAMIMKAAFGDIESVGQLVVGEGGTQLLHHGVALWGISADKMPKAFFKISR